MNDIECMNTIANYMKTKGYRYFENLEQGIYTLNVVYDKRCKNCPNEALESNICFYEDGIEFRLFYTELASTWCKRSEHRKELLELIAYINNELLKEQNIQNYNYNTILKVTEDFDITIIAHISYRYYASNVQQTNDYLTNHCVELLNNISIPIFFVMFGKITVQEAKRFIKNSDVIKKEQMSINDIFYS